MNYWLMKSEPDAYGIEDLKRDRTTVWDGVRNYQARNFLRSMAPGDLVFFYHSNTTPPGIVGLMKVAEANIDDPTQFDAKNKYYDPKATKESPRWQTVVVAFVEIFPQFLSLDALRETFNPNELSVVRQGNRLSVMPVPEEVAQTILKQAKG
ncbi:EVE domain-containing protein [Phormidium sp. FACHB-592]|uniref:EVE domain-containing protein n=1 Tax=Stenomitos frigidus AS-A4 TaxID=2933935 RepID=A0ABV0KK41_9CYAN|nr:EVE domain-containing protein [Phormidium sp. FACHB-592]MBD2072767.1 EVE domain-containing protein [Phormidium sp. FACHB-592]